MSLLPEVSATTRHLIFDGVEDARYSFPVWSWMSSRGMKIFFTDGSVEETIGGRGFGYLEVMEAAVHHKAAKEGRLARIDEEHSTPITMFFVSVLCGPVCWKRRSRSFSSKREAIQFANQRNLFLVYNEATQGE